MALQWRRRRKPGRLEDLLLAERLAREQRLHERVERLAVRAEQAQRLSMALADDALHFLVHQPRGFLADHPLAPEAANAAEIRIVARRKLDHAERVAHAPARDHVAGEGGGLLDVAFGTRRARAVY